MSHPKWMFTHNGCSKPDYCWNPTKSFSGSVVSVVQTPKSSSNLEHHPKFFGWNIKHVWNHQPVISNSTKSSLKTNSYENHPPSPWTSVGGAGGRGAGAAGAAGAGRSQELLEVSWGAVKFPSVSKDQTWLGDPIHGEDMGRYIGNIRENYGNINPKHRKISDKLGSFNQKPSDTNGSNGSLPRCPKNSPAI